MAEPERMEMHFEAFRLYRPQPGDVMIVKPTSERVLSMQAVEQIKETLKASVPDYVKVLVFSSELEIEVIRPGEAK